MIESFERFNDKLKVTIDFFSKDFLSVPGPPSPTAMRGFGQFAAQDHCDTDFVYLDNSRTENLVDDPSNIEIPTTFVDPVDGLGKNVPNFENLPSTSSDEQSAQKQKLDIHSEVDKNLIIHRPHRAPNTGESSSSGKTKIRAITQRVNESLMYAKKLSEDCDYRKQYYTDKTRLYKERTEALSDMVEAIRSLGHIIREYSSGVKNNDNFE